ncbi:hypothetical protein EDD16DRAFT_1523687 [Pisolithus croceorrhizus]|nr:hypothetical protein EDD16DRAFT_1523687 [Pisolithus croceorrhizus]
MPKGERRDAKMSEMCDPGLVTLLRHENSNNSATANARATGCTSASSERFGAELHELQPKRGRGQEGSIASARNCQVESYKTPGGDGDARGESGERGIGEKRVPVPEISAKPSHTLLSTEKTHISTMSERVLKKKISSSRFASEKIEWFGRELRELGLKRGRRWEDGIASVGNRWAEFYETSGGDRGAQGELGDRGNRENGASNPEIFAKRCDPACLPRNRDIFVCAGAIATKGIPLERYRRVHPESRFARGMDEWSSRYRVGEVGGMTKARGCLIPVWGTRRAIYS